MGVKLAKVLKTLYKGRCLFCVYSTYNYNQKSHAQYTSHKYNQYQPYISFSSIKKKISLGTRLDRILIVQLLDLRIVCPLPLFKSLIKFWQRSVALGPCKKNCGTHHAYRSFLCQRGRAKTRSLATASYRTYQACTLCLPSILQFVLIRIAYSS